MKTIKCFLISLVVSLLVVNVAIANDYTPAIKVENKQLHVSLENVAPKTMVKIQDQEGLVLIEEEVNTTGNFDHVFNLEKLLPGSYELIIKSPAEETVQNVTITEEGLIVDENERATFYPVIFSQRGTKLKLSLLNPTNSTLRIFILDHLGRLTYQYSIEDQMVVEKDYNLKQLPAGRYTVIVDNSREIYTKQLRL